MLGLLKIPLSVVIGYRAGLGLEKVTKLDSKLGYKFLNLKLLQKNACFFAIEVKPVSTMSMYL